MIEQINQLVTTIVIILILATFFELLLPDSAIKKYVKLVIGLMIVLTILNPVVQLIDGDYVWDPNLFDESNLSSDTEEIIERGEELQIDNEEAINEEYEDILTEHIAHLTDRKFENLTLSHITLDFEKDVDSPDYGEINHLEIYLANNETNSQVESVEKVEINILQEDSDDSDDKPDGGVEVTEKQEQNIITMKDRLKENLELSPENIRVTMIES